MIVLAIISYSMPQMTGRNIYDSRNGHLAFWLSNIGMLGMTAAFGAAGVAQVYMERIVGLDFMVSAKAIQPHFFVLIIAATVFTTGITFYIIDFVKFGLPNDEAMKTAEDEFEVVK